MKFVVLIHSVGVSGSFYELVLSAMGAAAARLDVELETVIEPTHERMIEAGKEIAARRHRPDCVLFPNHQGVGHELLPILDSAGIPAFVLIEGLTPTDIIAVGPPRTKLPRWLGQMYPDDVAVGKLLGERLVQRAHASGLAGKDGKVHVGIIAGDQTPAGQLRFQGWLALRRERPEIVQAGVQYSNWLEEPARAATEQLLRSHPEVSVIWAANDDMALGAVEAVRASGRRPGRDVLIGGVDLLPRALQYIADGTMAVSLGGHFLDGARALILVHDHLRGRDFEPWVRRSTLEPVTPERAPTYLRSIREQAWRNIEFERYSRVRAGSDDVPELNLEALVGRGRGGASC